MELIVTSQKKENIKYNTHNSMEHNYYNMEYMIIKTNTTLNVFQLCKSLKKEVIVYK